MRQLVLSLILCISILLVPLYSYAQFGGSSFSLELSPQLPEANEVFSIKLVGNSENRVVTQWFINGTENTALKNQNSINLQAGSVGSVTNITARVSLLDGSILEAKSSVIPNRVDLIVEANTTVPPFYNGRKLPSSGSKVNVTALVFTKEKLPSKEYSYSWKLNGKTQNSAALKGVNTFSFVPAFEDKEILTVDVFDKTGKHIISKSQIIPIVKPELNFYEKNPLRGLSFIALTDPYIFVGDEITVQAWGYFMDNAIQNANLLTEWKINGKTQENVESPSREITLSKEGYDSSIELSYHIRNLKQLLQGVKKTLEIQF